MFVIMKMYLNVLFHLTSFLICVSEGSKVIPQPPNCGISRTTSSRPTGLLTAKLGEFPWIAPFEYETKTGTVLHCTGSLINSDHLLTSASCVSNIFLGENKLTKVYLGEHDTSTDPDCEKQKCSQPRLGVEIINTKIHEDYKPDTHENDIAIVQLIEDVPEKYMTPICLPSNVKGFGESQSGSRGVVSGWGDTSRLGSVKNIKQKLVLPIVDRDTCMKEYEDLGVKVTDKHLCLGGDRKPDGCHTYDGAPLMQKIKDHWAIEGISVHGNTCGKDHPTLYTKVSEFEDWIRQNLQD